MKIRESVRTAAAFLLVAAATVCLSGCGVHNRPYYFPENNFAGRPIPPSQFDTRVMVAVSNSGALGSSGALAILDAQRDLRYSVFNVTGSFSISGFGTNNPSRIFSYPEQLRGVIYSSGDGSITTVNYGTEATSGATASLAGISSDVFVPSDLAIAYSAQEGTGLLQVVDQTGSRNGTYTFSLPGAYKVAVNVSHTSALVMTRNTNNVYRIVKINTGDPAPAGNLSCLPSNNPVYCVLPVTGTFDRPYGAIYSNDGSQAYILNCGPECGGTTASVSIATVNDIRYDNYPGPSAVTPYPSPVTKNIPVPGGATMAISDGTTLYVSGQSRAQLVGTAADANPGLYTGYLSSISLASQSVTGVYSISDGLHTKMLFADNNTLWIGSQSCATGKRQASGQNYNCLTRFDLGAKTPQVVPNAFHGGPSVPYPNTDQNLEYYNSLTGLCWVQNKNKVYTAYGGQVHAFNTADGSEINNFNVTVQGIALDVAYIDALTNSAN